MSFLQDIQKFSKDRLSKVKTSVTQQDGTKYLEERNEQGQTVSSLQSGSSFGFVADYSTDTRISKIIPGIFIGSQDVAANKELLTQSQITHILNVAPNVNNHYPQDFTYCHEPLMDLPETKLSEHLPKCHQFIDECVQMQDSNVLVHCNAGVSRATSVVISYLIRSRSMAFHDALALVKQQHPPTRPNDGFLQQLQDMGNCKNVSS